LETGERALAAGSRREKLDGRRTPQQRMTSFPDDAHRSLAQTRDEPVRAYPFRLSTQARDWAQGGHAHKSQKGHQDSGDAESDGCPPGGAERSRKRKGFEDPVTILEWQWHLEVEASSPRDLLRLPRPLGQQSRTGRVGVAQGKREV